MALEQDVAILASGRSSLDLAKQAYTMREFCQTFGIGKTLAYEHIKEGRLVTRKVGSRTLIRAEDAKAWLDALPKG